MGDQLSDAKAEERRPWLVALTEQPAMSVEEYVGAIIAAEPEVTVEWSVGAIRAARLRGEWTADRLVKFLADAWMKEHPAPTFAEIKDPMKRVEHIVAYQLKGFGPMCQCGHSQIHHGDGNRTCGRCGCAGFLAQLKN